MVGPGHIAFPGQYQDHIMDYQVLHILLELTLVILSPITTNCSGSLFCLFQVRKKGNGGGIDELLLDRVELTIELSSLSLLAYLLDGFWAAVRDHFLASVRRLQSDDDSQTRRRLQKSQPDFRATDYAAVALSNANSNPGVPYAQRPDI